MKRIRKADLILCPYCKFPDRHLTGMVRMYALTMGSALLGFDNVRCEGCDKVWSYDHKLN